MSATLALGALSAGGAPVQAAGAPAPRTAIAATTGSRRDSRGASPVPVAAAPLAQGSPAAQPAVNVWAAMTGGLPDIVADLPPRVYVPHELGGDVAVIDPGSMQIVDRFWVGRTPHHVTPAHNLYHLYVNVMDSNALVMIDPWIGRPIGSIPVPVPYNLYFTPDSKKAVVAAERYNRLDFFDAATWQPLARLPIPGSGVDHLDFSADGSYLLVGCEFGGQLVKVSIDPPVVVGVLRAGGLPIDVKLSPDGSVFYVANQGRHGVSIVDPVAMQEIGFLPTGLGAHGMAISRDTRSLYVANRLAGTISVIDFAAGSIAATWPIGGSLDMLQVSSDGKQLWASGRNHGSVYVIDTESGQLAQRIPTGAAPHGLTYFPQPGRYSIGHNGVYR
jgi:DNA-binding beta-propeller fold protein YncE